MNDKEKLIVKIISQLKGSSEQKALKVFFERIENEPFLFDCEYTFLKERALELYEDNYNIQKKITKREVVIGYQAFLNNLTEIQDSQISLCTFIISDSTYLFFFDLKLRLLIGYLVSYNQNIDQMKELLRIYKERGFKTEMQEFNLHNFSPTGFSV